MPTGGDIVKAAATHLGKPYVWGAEGPNAFDCSGLVVAAFKAYGISLPHKAEQQAKLGTAVSKDDIQPGDLVFSNWGDGTNSHVGIATSSGQIIVARHKHTNVQYQTLNAGYLSHVTAIRRIKGITNTGGGAGATSGGLTPNGTGSSGGGTTSGATRTNGGTSSGSSSAGGGSSSTSSGPFAGIADAIRTGLRPLTGAQVVADGLAQAWLPTTIIRIVCGIAGMVFIGYGTILIAREVKS